MVKALAILRLLLVGILLCLVIVGWLNDNVTCWSIALVVVDASAAMVATCIPACNRRRCT